MATRKQWLTLAVDILVVVVAFTLVVGGISGKIILPQGPSHTDWFTVTAGVTLLAFYQLVFWSPSEKKVATPST